MPVIRRTRAASSSDSSPEPHPTSTRYVSLVRWRNRKSAYTRAVRAVATGNTLPLADCTYESRRDVNNGSADRGGGEGDPGLRGPSGPRIREADELGMASLIEAAEASGVQRFVYVSYAGLDRSLGTPLERAKAATERRLMAARAPARGAAGHEAPQPSQRRAGEHLWHRRDDGPVR